MSATDWDQRYREGRDGWELGQAAPPLDAFLRSDIRSPQPPGRVLVPGCGRGHEAALLAELGFEVIGLDLSAEAIDRARALHGPDRPQLRWLQADLFDPAALAAAEFTAGSVEGVLEHTCFCAIPRDKRPDYVKSVARALRPGGLLLAVFYINPRDDPDPTLGPPFGSEPSELAERFEPWFEVEESGPARDAFPERTGREQVWRLRRRPMCAL